MSSQTGVVSSTTGTTTWASPQNIYTSNNVYASIYVTNGATTNYLYALGNGFTIPSGATIDGIELIIEGKNQNSGTGMTLRPSQSSDCYVRYDGTDISIPSSSGISQQSWTGTTDTTKTFGSPTSLWGVTTTLTPAIVNAASFGFRMRFYNSGTAQTLYVDRVTVIVYFTEGGIQSSQQLFMSMF